MPGRRAQSATVAAIPSRPGITMSVTITSGRGVVRRPEQGVPVRDRGDDVELRLEQLSQLFGDPRVVFGEQDPWSIHAPTVGAYRAGHNPENHGGDSGELLRRAPGGAAPAGGRG